MSNAEKEKVESSPGGDMPGKTDVDVAPTPPKSESNGVAGQGGGTPTKEGGSVEAAAPSVKKADLVVPSKGGRSAIPPKRLVRGGVTSFVGALLAFTIMSIQDQFRWGVPFGLLGVIICSIGILDLLGSFEHPQSDVAKSTPLGVVAPWFLGLLGSLLFTFLVIGFTVKGALPIGATLFLAPAGVITSIAVGYRTGAVLGIWGDDPSGQPRPLLMRHGFWVLVAGTVLYLPMAGSYSLSDPWETHYGEVAREILARNDWISLWWAQDGWFWSKPILDFWMQAVVMGIFGVKYQPDQMLVGAASGHSPWPEWAVRMPVFVLTMIALFALYKGVAKVFGRRAGLLGALVLATMPQWYLLAHQTITDMPMVSALSTAMGLLMLGIHTDPEQRVKAYEIRVGNRAFHLSAFHLALGVVLVSALPQALYLLSRNITFQFEPMGFRWHLDEFTSGSAGNCGLPGNENCNPGHPANPQFQPGMQGLMWLGVLGLVLSMNWNERRLSRVYFLGAWYFAAVATMGKGPAGFMLPICVTFTYLAVTRKWAQLLSVEIVSGLLIILAVAIPWYLAMYIRHGQPFTDRLIFHDMWKRAMTHVHDTNEGDDVSFRYFIWQLGYAFFPWTGLVPAGLTWWARRSDDANKGQGDVSVFLAMWFVFAFALFTAMLTKFHHYIFPAVPPAAMLTGIFLDELLGKGSFGTRRQTALYVSGLGLSALLGVYGMFRLFPGRLDGFRPDSGELRPPSYAIAAVCILASIAVCVFVVRMVASVATGALAGAGGPSVGGAGLVGGDDSETPEDNHPAVKRHESLMIGGVGLAAAIVVALAGRDMWIKTEPGDTTGQARLLYLFTYNYRRAFPESLDWNGLLTAFTIVATLLCLLLVVAKWRRHVTILMTATALAWAAWGVNIYLVKCAPHWGQREVVEAYYKLRRGPEEPIVAYQMNWKGENFYAGNRIPAFVSSGAPFSNWIKTQQEKGVRTFYFVTEHGRTSALRSEAGNPRVFEVLTDKRLNNKFCLSRAVFDPPSATPQPAAGARPGGAPIETAPTPPAQ